MHAILRIATLSAATALLPLAAHAVTPFFESASFVDESVANGDYPIYDTRYLGAVFTVNSAEQVNAIGGNFTAYGDGNSIFGAIVPVGGSGMPGDVATTAVAWALFTPTGGDQTVALNNTLQPGKYALVFGSGLFGATGYSGLVAAQTAIGAPTFVDYPDGTTASAFGDDTLRLTVYATAAAVPEPSMLVLWCAGSLGLLALRSRARK